jgi:transcriptional regulator NrdR family protein
MQCPKCGCKSTRVTKVFHKKDRTFRYRLCNKCKEAIKTVEFVTDGFDYKAVVEKIRKLVVEGEEK